MAPTDHGRSFEREQEFLKVHSLDAAVRMFINRWAPEGGPRDFEADLIQIVQRIYREAQAPYWKAMAEVVVRQPMPPMFVTKSD